jgi:PKD repeat protein
MVDSFPAVVSLGNDTTLCKGNNLYLQSGESNTEYYLWSTGDTTDHITLQAAGEYSVTATNTMGCTGADTVNIEINGIAPVPGFTFSNQCFGDTVTFTDASTSPDGSAFTNWLWNFGDENTSENQNSRHQFADTGIYTVTLTVATQNNCANSIRKNVDIYSNPVAAFLPGITCSHTQTTLHDISTSADGNITHYRWLFPDGSADTVQNPKYTFTLAGQNTVKLIVKTNLACSDTLTKNIDVKQGPVADFSYSAACNQKPVYFTDKSESFLNSPLSYKWIFGNEENISTQNNPQYTFPDTGSYTVTLEVNQQLNNCYGSISKTLSVKQNPVVAFTKEIFCEKNSASLTDISTSPQGTITNRIWKIDSVGTLSGEKITVRFDTTGTYKTILTVKDNNGCFSDTTDTITVFPLPQPYFTVNVEKGAVPLFVEFDNQTVGGENYLWNFGDGNTSQEFSPAHTYSDSGYYTAKLFAVTAKGCIDSVSTNIKAVVAHTDIAVVEAFAEKQNGFLKVSAIIQNYGTLDLNNIELFYKANYGQTIKEILPFTLESGQTINYEFVTQMQIKKDINLTHICIWALPGSNSDENPVNNEKCIAFENAFKAMQPYPNPAKDKLVVEYIIPYESQVEILLFNQFGKLTNKLYQGKSKAGINRLIFDIRTLSRGIYIYRIEFEDNIKSYQIIVE